MKKRMTEKKFLEKLAATRGKFQWRLDKKKMLRAKSDKLNYCPITAVQANEGGEFNRVDEANGDFLNIPEYGIDEFSAEEIMAAADNDKSSGWSSIYDPNPSHPEYRGELRKKMLRVLGLDDKV